MLFSLYSRKTDYTISSLTIATVFLLQVCPICSDLNYLSLTLDFDIRLWGRTDCLFRY